MPQLSLIQSAQNSMVKHAYSLKVSKKAKESEDFLCEGFHLVHEAQLSGLKIRFIFATKAGWNHIDGQKVLEQAQKAKVKCFEVSPKIVTYLAETITPEGILAVVAKPASSRPQPPFPLALAVYQVQDPGNLGTLFRSAEAFGARGIFLTEGCCDPFNPKVIRASMGSLFRLSFVMGKPWKEYMDWFTQNGFHSYALEGAASKSFQKVNFQTPVSIWIGSEGSGLPPELSNRCDERVSIPMEGKIESLNAGVAGSLALFWARFGRPVS